MAAAVYDEMVISRRMLCALVAALLFVAGAVFAPPTASADDHYLDVEITSVSTPVLDFSNPDQVVELRGTLTNTSTTTITDAIVHFWRLPVAIRSTEQLAELEASTPVGSRLTPEENLWKVAALGPGERAAFTVHATIAQLTQGSYRLPEDNATYLIGAQVRATPADTQLRAIVGDTFFPITATSTPVASSAVVELSATPSWLTDGSFIDDSLATDLNSRLDTLLASAERPTVIAAIDPALYEAAKRMSTTHQVAGQETAGNGVAARWVQRVDALAAAGRLWRLPYGNPNFSRIAATSQLDEVLGWEHGAVGSTLSSVPTVAIVSNASPDLVSQLDSFDTVIVRGGIGSQEGTTALLGAMASSSVPASAEGAGLARRITAEYLSPSTPLHVIDSPEAASLDAELGRWRTHVAPEAGAGKGLVWPSVAEVSAWGEVAKALDTAGDNAALLSDLTAASSSVNLASLGALSWSANFLNQDQSLAYVAAASPQTVDLKKVTLRAASSFVMGSRTNTFPATLTNGLSVPITVGVDFHSDSPHRIRVPKIEPVTIAPGESYSFDITPEASSNGVALVKAQAVTTDGVTVGESVTIEITATDFGRVGWIIILISGAVVLGGTAWRIRAVRRENSKAAAKEDSVPSQ